MHLTYIHTYIHIGTYIFVACCMGGPKYNFTTHLPYYKLWLCQRHILISQRLYLRYSASDVYHSPDTVDLISHKTSKVNLHCCSECFYFEHATNSNQLLHSLLEHYLRYSPCNNIHDLETETSLHPNSYMCLTLRHLATSHYLTRIHTLMPSSEIYSKLYV